MQNVNNNNRGKSRRTIVLASADSSNEADEEEEDDEESKKSRELKRRLLSNLTAGAIAGALAKTTIAPLDRTKIYFQTTPSAPFSTRTVLRYITLTFRSHGFFALFRGNSATMARIVPYSAIQFTAHEQYKTFLEQEKDLIKSADVRRFLAGSLAGVTAQGVTYPLDLTRARLAVSPRHKYKNLREVFVKILREEGFKGLWRGLGVTLLGVIPYAGCSFYTYETLKHSYHTHYEVEASPLVRLGFGAVAGVFGQTSSYPLDIVRRRMQVGLVRGEDYKGKGGRFGVGGVGRVLREIWRKEGLVHGLYKGLSMNWIKGPVAAGISFSVFDYLSRGLRGVG